MHVLHNLEPQDPSVGYALELIKSDKQFCAPFMTVVVKNSDIFFHCLFYIIAKELLAKDYCLSYGSLPKSCLPNYCLPYGGLPMITACLMAACLFTLLPFYPLAKLLVSLKSYLLN